MRNAVVEALVTSGQLRTFVGEAAVLSIEPLCGIPVEVIGEAPLPWANPPVGIALVSLADADGSEFQGVAWVGGEFTALAAVTEVLVGERPSSEDDELLQDAIRELANIVAGRMQERLHGAGLRLSLGLPVFVGGARSLNVGASLVNGAAVLVRLGLPDEPVLAVGFAAKEA
ncbi:chemotaxis protein CheX [Thermorudis peleae]|uniref:chemotaxis protein CheX n=1 Tax=Thermorudis peleae TaxID=1382356 RepID=UPI00056DC98C|nr:chemotaxis protein CheX [Thermorudis peleae]